MTYFARFNKSGKTTLFPLSALLDMVPELRQLIDEQCSLRLKTTEEHKKCISFMANYIPWPYPLNPEWFDVYIDALDRFKGDCKSTRFSSVYSREFCKKTFQIYLSHY